MFYKGKIFEKIALNYLKKKGYELIQTNYYTKYGEIDLIMFKDMEYKFIEVKAVDSNEFSIYEQITKSKIKRINKAIQTWLIKNNIPAWSDFSVEWVGFTKASAVKYYIVHDKIEY